MMGSLSHDCKRKFYAYMDLSFADMIDKIIHEVMMIKF